MANIQGAIVAVILISLTIGTCNAFVSNGQIYYYPFIMAPYQTIGGGGGSPFDTTNCDGDSWQWVGDRSAMARNGPLEIVSKIQVFTARETLHGIKITTTQGKVHTFGSASCDMQELVLDHDKDQGIETITALSLWDNCVGSRSGGVKITTIRGKVLDVSMKCKDRCQEFKMDVGSGILCGVYGRAGSELDTLGFSFLKKILDRTLSITGIIQNGVSYKMVGTNSAVGRRVIDAKNAATTVIRTDTYTSRTAFRQMWQDTHHWKLGLGVKVSTSTQVSVLKTIETAFGVEFSATIEAGGQYTNARETVNETTQTKTFQYTCLSRFVCQYYEYMIQADYTASYTGYMLYQLEGGTWVAYYETGTHTSTTQSLEVSRQLDFCCSYCPSNFPQERPCVACCMSYNPAEFNGRKLLGAAAVNAAHPTANGTEDRVFVDVKSGASTILSRAAPWQWKAGGPKVPKPSNKLRALPASDKSTCRSDSKECRAVEGGALGVVVNGTSAGGILQAGFVEQSDLLDSLLGTAKPGGTVVATYSPSSCNSQMCTHFANLKVVDKSKNLVCKHGQSVMTLATAFDAVSLQIPKPAKTANVQFSIVGEKVAGKPCQYAVKLLGLEGMESSKSSSRMTTDIDQLVCGIGMAKCKKAGVANPETCCGRSTHDNSRDILGKDESKDGPGRRLLADCNCPQPSSNCFPGDAVVQLEGGYLTTMEKLKIGDKVQVMTGSGRLDYEPIYLFGHKDGSTWSSMTLIEAQSPFTKTSVQIRMSSGHFIPIDNGSGGWKMVRAKDVTVGDLVLATANGSGVPHEHTVISVAKEPSKGLFNPFTASGTIIVDGVVASVHSEWFLDGIMDALNMTQCIPSIYQVILLPGYYFVYCTLGPDWVQWLDSKIDFATTGTDSPVVTVLSLWAYVGTVGMAMWKLVYSRMAN